MHDVALALRSYLAYLHGNALWGSAGIRVKKLIINLVTTKYRGLSPLVSYIRSNDWSNEGEFT